MNYLIPRTLMNAADLYRQKYYSPAYAARVDIDGTPLLDDLVRRFLPSEGCVLEVGAGGGIGRKHPCRQPGISLSGIDPSPLVNNNPDLDCSVCQTAETMPFETDSFDLVFSDFAFEHIVWPEDVIKEVRRVLKPGGTLVFRTVNAYHYVALIASVMPDSFRDVALERAGRTEAFPTRYRFNTRRRIRRVLEGSGFEIKHLVMIEGPPDYLAFSPSLYWLGTKYERLANSHRRLDFMKANIIVVAS